MFIIGTKMLGFKWPVKSDLCQHPLPPDMALCFLPVLSAIVIPGFFQFLKYVTCFPFSSPLYVLFLLHIYIAANPLLVILHIPDRFDILSLSHLGFIILVIICSIQWKLLEDIFALFALCCFIIWLVPRVQ